MRWLRHSPPARLPFGENGANRKNEDDDFRKKAETYTKYIQDKKEPYWSIYENIRDISVTRIKAN